MSVEALARMLLEYAISDDRTHAITHHEQAERILADPTPLLEALAAAGVLEREENREPCEWRCDAWTVYDEPCGWRCRHLAPHGDGHECEDGHRRPGSSQKATDQVKAIDLHQAQQMLADPAPLLAALPDGAIEAEALRRFYPARHLTGMSDR